MRELPLFDGGQRPSSWTDRMRSPQHAVLHLDERTGVVVAPSGAPVDPAAATCLVFDDLEGALGYAARRVEQPPRVACDVYDHRGKSATPLRLRSAASRARAGRMAHWTVTGAVFLTVLGLATCAADLVIPQTTLMLTVVGSKIATSGGLLLGLNRRHLRGWLRSWR